jgi:uncharacterized membrane protein
VRIEANEARWIEHRIAEVEAATGVQVVTAVVPIADDYPEAPWRAFALFAAMSALGVWALELAQPDGSTSLALLRHSLAILGAGAAGWILARFVPALRRAFIRDARAQAEVRQCAEALFLTRELFATPARTTVLILVSALERRVVVVPDAGYRGRVSTAEWRGVVEAMRPALHRGRLAEGFEQGLVALQALLVARGFTAGDGVDRVPNALVRGEATR